MSRLTHPYVLIVVVFAASALLAVPVARRRARLHEVRRRQEEVVSELILANNQAVYLRRKRHELLTNPATITEIAQEHYGYGWEGRHVVGFEPDESPMQQQPPRVRIVETGWERFLGSGEYIWTLPVALTGLCAAAFAVFGFFEKKRAEPDA